MDKFALLIGNSEYDDISMPNLEAPEIDANSFAEVLRSPLIANFNEVKTLNNRPFSEVQLAIARLFAEKKTDDLVLLYFSGHGIVDDPGNLYLAVKDTLFNLRSGSAISAEFIVREMDNCTSKRQIMILDCCYSGAFSKGMKSSIHRKILSKSTFQGNGYGRVVLTASSEAGVALDSGHHKLPKANSPFTYFLIEGLRAGAADLNNDGHITIDEWYSYTFSKVLDVTRKQQKPKMWIYGQEGGQLIIANVDRNFIRTSAKIKPYRIITVNPLVFSSIFSGPSTSILCPYCLSEIRYHVNKVTPLLKCLCGIELPVLYIDEYSKSNPIFVQILGWTSAGKSTYLQRLTMVIQQIDQFWKDFVYLPLSEATLKYNRYVRSSFANGELPQATQLGLQEAYIMRLYGMELWGSRTIILRDVAGEYFTPFEFPVQYLPYFLHVPTTCLMLSLFDIKENPEYAIDQLLVSYLNTMQKFNSPILKDGVNILVILSKADKIVSDLPPIIQEYLSIDPLHNILAPEGIGLIESIDIHAYICELIEISRILRDWIENSVPGGKNFVGLANRFNIHIEFTIVSSLGVDFSNETTPSNIRPTRIIDPLLWLFELQNPS